MLVKLKGVSILLDDAKPKPIEAVHDIIKMESICGVLSFMN